MNGNVFSLIENTVADPARVCLSTATGETMSYGDLVAGAWRSAAALRAHGVRPGDRVAVQTDKTVHSVLLYLGTLAAGGVYLPLNTAYTPHEVGYFLDDAQPTVLVCASDRQGALADIARAAGVRHVLTLDADDTGTAVDAAAAQATGAATVARGADDLAAILYTSGTTGRAKGAMLSHGNLATNALTLIDEWRITTDDCLLHALPVYHVHGLFVGINTMLLAGGSMRYLRAFDAGEMLDHLPAATMVMGVPTFYSRMLALPAFDRRSTSHVRVFISGSAPLSAQIHKDFAERTGHAIVERYGMTETGMNTSNPYDGEQRPGTVGMALADIEVRVADPDSGAALAPGETGSIEVRGPNVFAGYWRNEEKTAEAFRADGFFITGDLGRYDTDGYLSIVGRDKDLIISGGLNIYPAEIEAALDAIGGVGESAVIGAPHGDFGEAVVAVVAARQKSSLTAETISDDLGQRLARFKLPKAVVFVDALPRNAMGKIQKNVLRETYGGVFADVVGGGSR